MENNNLNKYVCTRPFNYLEIYDTGVYCCCSSWNNKKIGELGKLDEIYNNEETKKVQESVLDGSYRYCSKVNCPFLLNLQHNNQVGDVFIKKEDFNPDIIGKDLTLKLCIDKTCNLACPSCRVKYLIANSREIDVMNNNMEEIINVFGKNTKEISVSGSADPFASNIFRNFLINFNENDFPNLKSICLHTNGLLLDENMWKRIEKAHKYINQIEISIDAATPQTYAKLRGGNWDVLIENIKFLINVPNFDAYIFSFVVQDENYKEMISFVELISKIAYNKFYNVNFNKIVNWGTFTNEEFNQKEIFNEKHPNFNDFLKEANKVVNIPQVNINMGDIITKYNLKGNKKTLI